MLGPALPPHALKVVLMHPQIAPNTGNIGRLCVAAGAQFHLVRPLGFVISDKSLKRSGMDYWPRLNLTIHDDQQAFLRAAEGQRLWMFTSKATRGLWEADFAAEDWLVFGSETHGRPPDIVARFADKTVRIPQIPGERCLNLSTAVGIGLYEALRQL